MPIEQKDETVAAAPADSTVDGAGGDVSADSAGAHAGETTAPAKPKRPRQRKPQPTFDDGAVTRVFKFPSRTYPRSAYYVTNDEIIVRIKKARHKWQLTFPKKRIVSYRTNRWFHKPRWVEIELTYPQAVRHGLVAPTAAPAQAAGSAPAPIAAAADELSAGASVVEGGVPVNEVDAEKPKDEQPGAAALVPPPPASLSALLARVAHVAQNVEALSETARAVQADAQRPASAEPMSERGLEAGTSPVAAAAHPRPEDNPSRLGAADLPAESAPAAPTKPTTAMEEAAAVLARAAAVAAAAAPAAEPVPRATLSPAVTDHVPTAPSEPAGERPALALPAVPATADSRAAAIPITAAAVAAAGVAAALQSARVPAAAAAERERPAAYYGSKAQRRALADASHAAVPAPPRGPRAVWLWAPVVAMLLLTTGVIWSQWAGDDDYEMSIVRARTTREGVAGPAARDAAIVTAGIEPADLARGGGAALEQRSPAPSATSAGPGMAAPVEAPKMTPEPARQAAPPTAQAAQKQASARDTAPATAAERKRVEAEAASKKAADDGAARRRAADDAAKRRAEEEAAKQRAREDNARRQAQAGADAAAARRAAELATQASREPIPIPGAAPARSSLGATQTCRDVVASAASTVAIQFEFASASLRQASVDALHRLAASLAACPSVRVRIEGHTDSDGDLNRNQILSERRASAVVQTLIVAGCSAAQLTAVGLGQSRPLAPNDTADNKRRNRRIDLVVN